MRREPQRRRTPVRLAGARPSSSTTSPLTASHRAVLGTTATTSPRPPTAPPPSPRCRTGRVRPPPPRRLHARGWTAHQGAPAHRRSADGPCRAHPHRRRARASPPSSAASPRRRRHLTKPSRTAEAARVRLPSRSTASAASSPPPPRPDRDARCPRPPPLANLSIKLAGVIEAEGSTSRSLQRAGLIRRMVDDLRPPVDTAVLTASRLGPASSLSGHAARPLREPSPRPSRCSARSPSAVASTWWSSPARPHRRTPTPRASARWSTTCSPTRWFSPAAASVRVSARARGWLRRGHRLPTWGPGVPVAERALSSSTATARPPRGARGGAASARRFPRHRRR